MCPKRFPNLNPAHQLKKLPTLLPPGVPYHLHTARWENTYHKIPIDNPILQAFHNRILLQDRLKTGIPAQSPPPGFQRELLEDLSAPLKKINHLAE